MRHNLRDLLRHRWMGVVFGPAILEITIYFFPHYNNFIKAAHYRMHNQPNYVFYYVPDCFPSEFQPFQAPFLL